MSSPGGLFRAAAAADSGCRRYTLPVRVEVLRADMATIAQIVVKTVGGICDIDPMYPLALTEEPSFARFTPKGQKPVIIKFSELSTFQKS
jgi:hypothetical protein